MTTGENIKKARKAAGLTQQQLADKLNITQSAVAKFESDKTNVKYTTLEKFAAALNVSVFDLADNAGKLFQNHISEWATLEDTGVEFFRLLLQDESDNIECVRDYDYVGIDYDGEPITGAVLKVYTDNRLRYSIKQKEFDEIMHELLNYFKVSVSKYYED